MQHDPLDADNSQKYFKDDHLMEWYTCIRRIYKPVMHDGELHYKDVKQLMKLFPPLLDNILDESVRFRLINKKIDTVFRHCFFNSLDDARCVANMLIMIENLFINMSCMSVNALYVIDDDSIEVYLKNILIALLMLVLVKNMLQQWLRP